LGEFSEVSTFMYGPHKWFESHSHGFKSHSQPFLLTYLEADLSLTFSFLLTKKLVFINFLLR